MKWKIGWNQTWHSPELSGGKICHTSVHIPEIKYLANYLLDKLCYSLATLGFTNVTMLVFRLLHDNITLLMLLSAEIRIAY